MGSWLILALVYGGYLLALAVLAKFAYQVVALEEAADAMAYRAARCAAQSQLLALPKKIEERSQQAA